MGYPVAYRDNLTAFTALGTVAFWVALLRESFGGLSWPCHCNVPEAQELKLSQEVRAAGFGRLQLLLRADILCYFIQQRSDGLGYV